MRSSHRLRRADCPAIIENLESRRLLSAGISPSQNIPPINPGGPIILPGSAKAIAVEIDAESGEAFGGVVGKFTGYSGTLNNIRASIDWGDGSAASAGTFARRADGTVAVSGDHTYAKAGKYKVTVTVDPIFVPPPNSTIMFVPLPIVIIHSKADVRPDKAGGVTLTEVAGQKFTARIGSFEFKNVDLAISVSIDWGDGKTSAGALEHPSLDDFNVIGSHTYANTGTFKVHVTVTARPIVGPGGPTPLFILLVANFDSKIIVKGAA